MKKMKVKAFSKQKSNSGFSLVEVLLAVVLLAIIVTPLMQVIVSSMATNQKSRELMAATNFAETIMEYCESKPFGTTDGVKADLDNPGAFLNLSCFPGLVPSYDFNDSTAYSGWSSEFESFQQKCIQHAYTMLSTPGAADPDYQFIYNSQDGKDFYCLMAYVYDGYQMDAYINFTPISVTESDDYVVYNVDVLVYGRDKNALMGDHSLSRPLVTLHGSTFESLEAD